MLFTEWRRLAASAGVVLVALAVVVAAYHYRN